jgi:hypothetical protein
MIDARARGARAPATLSHALLGVAVIAVVWLHVRGLPGSFLSDDFAHLDFIARADRDGRLGAWLLDRFVAGLDNGNYAFRPLAFLSYALDWRLYGAHPAGWHATNLLLHLATVALVYRLASRWTGTATGRAGRAGGAIAAALFAAYPFAGEVTFWLVGRFDLLAALFSVLLLATLDGGPAPAGVVRQAARIGCLLAALWSKESAMPLPFVALLIDAALHTPARAAAAFGAWRARLAFALRDLAPVLLAFGGYLALRAAIFGTPVKVYPMSAAPASIAEYLDRLSLLAALVTHQPLTRPPWLWAAVAGGLAASMCLAVAIRGARDPSRLRLVALACATSAVLYVLAPALSFPAAAESGEGARNYYVAWAYASLAIGVAGAATVPLAAMAGALCVWMLVGQEGSLRQWQDAAREMRAVAAAVPAFAAAVPPEGYALLLLPDAIGPAVFARNAQGGIVSRPVQREDHLGVVAGMTEPTIRDWRARLVDGSMARMKPGGRYDASGFLGSFCWNPVTQRFVRVGREGAVADPKAWERDLRAGVGRAPCLAGTLGRLP